MITPQVIAVEVALLFLIGVVGALWWFARFILKTLREDIAEIKTQNTDCAKQVNSINRILDRELRPNGGDSLRDRVIHIEAILDERTSKKGA